MNRFPGLSDVKEPLGVEDHGKDPDKTLRDKERDAQLHKNRMSFLKAVPLLSWVFFGFLVILFFVILPTTEMSLGNKTFGAFFQDWATAFIGTGATMGVALVTIAVPGVLHFVYKIMKDHTRHDK